MVCRLARRERAAAHQSVPHQSRRAEIQRENAPRSPCKKSPAREETIGALLVPWDRLAPTRSFRATVKSLAAGAGHLAPGQLTELIVAATVAAWRQRYARTTVYARVSHLRKLLAFLATKGAPLLRVKSPPKPPARETTASPGEIQALLQAAPFLRLFILLYLHAGLRFSETLKLTPKSWDRENHLATVIVKGDRVRKIPLTPEIETLLQAAGDQPPDRPYIWALHGRDLQPKSLRDAWLTHKKKHGIRGELIPHDLRRTAATIVYAATKDLRYPQQLLGHKSMSTTVGYLAPVADESIREAQQLLRFAHFNSEVKQ